MAFTLLKREFGLDPLLGLSLEGSTIMGLKGKRESKALYILLTDTKTRFSKLSKFLTRQPYNHVSVAFDEGLEWVYTYSLFNLNGLRGGLERETKEDLKGAHYALYRINVTEEVYRRVQERVLWMEANRDSTKYNHLGLINAIFQRDLIGNEDEMSGICSEFVHKLFDSAGVKLLNTKTHAVRPYDLIQSELLEFVAEGEL